MSADDATVRDEQRQPAEDLVSVVGGEFSVGEDDLDLRLEVENVTDRPVYVGCGFRRLDHDAGTRTVHFWMSDHWPKDVGTGRCGFVSTPLTAIVEPNESHLIEQSLALRFTRIVDDGSGHPDFEPVDLTATESVVVHSFVSERPFYLSGKAGGDVHEQTRRWGRPFTSTLSRITAKG